ncbi:MAG: hypothetical protein AAGJ32_03965 [Pseudomonadota bacterium]
MSDPLINPRPGDVVSIPLGIGLRHYGVVTLAGTVISRSSRHGGVVEQSLEAFADGRHVKRHRPKAGTNPFVTDARARRRVGADYSLTEANCVHHMRWVQGRAPTVIQRTLATVQVIGDMLGPTRRHRRW